MVLNYLINLQIYKPFQFHNNFQILKILYTDLHILQLNL